MMHEFLSENRADLIARCRAKVRARPSPRATEAELDYGIPLFLDQLVETLVMEQSGEHLGSRRVSGPAGGGKLRGSDIGAAASRHGRELLHHGFSVDQVVHDYGDLCQAITDLAFERTMPFQVDEFRTLNRCLDNAIAAAVTEFNYQRDFEVADQQADKLNERLGAFAHELRNLVNTATLAVTALKAGNVGLTGATGAVLDRSLVGLRTLIDRALAEVRMSAGMPVKRQLFSLADFIAEASLSAKLEAQMRETMLDVAEVDGRLAMDADRDLLLSALGNVLQNAFKFSHPGSLVKVRAYAAADRIRIDVEDGCGGLPPGSAGKLFAPFTQAGADKSGLGLGLSIARRGVEANGGTMSVHDLPGSGCVFTIDMPRHATVEPGYASAVSSYD